MTHAQLLDAIARMLKRFVVLPIHASEVLALWIAHAWALEAFSYSPPLAVTSPTKRCGKTRLLEVLELLVPRAWRVISPTEAVLFRTIETERPTVLLDEVDTIFKRDRDPATEGLRGLINAGNARGVTIPRCVPPSHAVKRFSVFCPKVLAGIGACLPDTVRDRSIPIALQRRARTENVERFRRRDVEPQALTLREHLEVFADEAVPELGDARPALPEALDDRAQDGWEPLLAVADLVGADWPTRARSAAVALHAAKPTDDTEVTLLQAIRAVFTDAGTDRMLTTDLLQALVAREGEPWGAWWGTALDKGDTRGPGFRLAKLLKPFDVVSKTVRVGGDHRGKGFEIHDFADAFARYLTPPENDVTTGQSLCPNGLRVETRRDSAPAVTSSDFAETLVPQGLSRRHVVEAGDEPAGGLCGVVLDLAASHGWPCVPLRGGLTVLGTELCWREFVERAARDDLIAVHRYLKRLSAG